MDNDSSVDFLGNLPLPVAHKVRSVEMGAAVLYEVEHRAHAMPRRSLPRCATRETSSPQHPPAAAGTRWY